MTGEIIPFPEPRPWSKYMHSREQRACAERLYEICTRAVEGLDGTYDVKAEAESMTCGLLKASAEIAARLRGDLPPAS